MRQSTETFGIMSHRFQTDESDMRKPRLWEKFAERDFRWNMDLWTVSTEHTEFWLRTITWLLISVFYPKALPIFSKILIFSEKCRWQMWSSRSLSRILCRVYFHNLHVQFVYISMREMNRFILAIIVILQEKLISVINIVMLFQVS